MKYGFIGPRDAAYRTVVDTFDAMGWERVNGPGWDALWSYQIRSAEAYLPQLTPGQRFNHLPGWMHYAGKRNSAVVRNYCERSGIAVDGPWDFCPTTYRLPEQREALRLARLKAPDDLWLAKPVASATKGRGLWILGRDEYPDAARAFDVQRYLARPHLIQERKYNVRAVVLLACADPLVVYLHREVNVVLSNEPYSISEEGLKNNIAHIVNSGLQRGALEEDQVVTRLSPEQWRDALRRDGADPDGVWTEIAAMLARYFQAAHEYLAATVRGVVPYRLNCFEMLGFDVLIDADFKPWIIECNLNPTISNRESAAERLRDTLALSGIHADAPPPASPAFGDTPVHADIHDPSGLRLLDTAQSGWLEHEAMNRGGFTRIVPAA